MKKLIAAGCCVLAFQSFSQVVSNDSHEQYNGKRMLLKAIAVMINSDAYRKAPPKPICLPYLESPRV